MRIPAPREAAVAGRSHVVSPGETLWSIARRYGVSVEDLARANRLADPSEIETGQTLSVPLRSAGRAPAPSNGFVWPVEGRVIGLFGTRRMGRINKGVDIQAPVGSDVRAARTGRVSFTSEGLPGFGKTIVIDHGDGYASVYAYVEQILVSRGDNVQQRQVIARVGSTGRTEVPALHFEIRRDQRPRNPLHYLP